MSRKKNKGLMISLIFIGTLLFSGYSVTMVGAQEEAPRYGGTFIFSGPAEPIVLCPTLAGDTYSNWILAQIMEPLVEYDESVLVQPMLAKSWEISDEGKTYTLKLEKGVKWHDGEDFTSEDVVYTYKTITEEAGVAVTHFEPVVDITAPDDHTVVIKLDRAVGGFLDGLVGNWLGSRIIPEHIYNTADYSIRENPANFNPIGTGPFKFVEWIKGSHVLMEANEDYWGEGPYIDKLIYKIIPEQTVNLLALEAGEVHYTGDVPGHELERLKQTSGISVYTGPDPSAGVLQLGTYTQSPGPIGDKRVRQALWLSIDNQLIVDELYYGAADPGSSTIGTASPYHNPNAGDKWGERPNYDWANQILDDAGYTIGSDGYRFTIEVMTRVGQTDREDICEILREAWKNIHVKLDIKLTEFTTLADKIKWGTPEPGAGRDFDMITWGSSTGPEPNTNTFPRYFHTGARNYYSYNSTVVNELMLQAQVEPDPVTRKALYFEVQKIMMEEDLPLLPLTHAHDVHIWWSQDWKGLPTLPYYGYTGFRNIWWVHGETKTTLELAETVEDITIDISELVSDLEGLSSRLEETSAELAESIGDVSTSIDAMSTLVGSVTDELKDDVTNLVGSVGDDLNDDVAKLQSTVGNMQLILILTLIVAAISLILPLVRKS